MSVYVEKLHNSICVFDFKSWNTDLEHKDFCKFIV